ncbi:MAG TPA: MBL fold metallo-hydrolase [Nocardioides sp.]|uniref:MBL fold metallo-hydrolase n=1 Tax=Nocardioides sp. TaxID=35761 RepID=UPI002C8F3D05|nr:MBL fold metallo-hydrolase [Nocardioides sp.]HQR27395.1 MBL fold metallo-hydrolase [Nocardioides sp.]
MTTAIRIEVLPARMGDCLLVECPREQGRPWRMLVDGGPPDTWPLLLARLQRLPADDRHLDVVVVTHIDSDHIGGMIPFLDSEFADEVGDFWFNGRTHLPGDPIRSVSQGESLVAALIDQPSARTRPWNLAFGGGPIDTGEEAGFLDLAPVDGGPRVTVLSPTTKRLTALAAAWYETVEAAKRGPGEGTPDVLEPLDDLAAVAAQESPRDASVPNGSSIALLLEHRGASVVLGADAFGTVLGAGLAGVAAARGLDTLPVDAFKLPHHGSKSNVIDAMLRVAPAQHYLVSSNGDIFHHPDDAALARVVTTRPGATLWFNYRTARTERWTDPGLSGRYGYDTRLPDDPDAGCVLELPAVP